MGRVLSFPPQHGAWAFLIVPLVLGAFLGAATWLGLVFAITWVAAYPVTYFGSRGVIARLRRGSWTDRARREMRAMAPWAVLTALGAVVLILARPRIVVAGVILGAFWAVSAWLTWKGRERGIVNDLLLVALASIATPLMWMVAQDTSDLASVPRSVWIAALVCLLFFVGSVLHVKSLIREARDPRWHRASIAFHALALATAAISWWLLIPFGLALLRTIVMKPGLRPGRIGAVEGVLAVLLVACTVLAVGGPG